MHAVDWLPTLMTAVGNPGLATTATDGVDQWQALTTRSPTVHKLVYHCR